MRRPQSWICYDHGKNSIIWYNTVFWDYLSLFSPTCFPFTHSERLSWWHLKLCVGSACICAWNSFPLSVRAQRAVQPRHRFQREMEEEMKRQEGGSECTIRMQSVALFFQPFSSWHAGKVCEILFEVHQCAHFKVHLRMPAWTLLEMKRGDTIRWNKSA